MFWGSLSKSVQGEWTIRLLENQFLLLELVELNTIEKVSWSEPFRLYKAICTYK